MNQLLYILCGAPGSGKSTWGKKFAAENNLVYYSTDESRTRFGTGEDDQSVSAQAFNYVREQLQLSITAGQSVVIDATNMYKKARKQWLDIVRYNPNIKKIAVVFKLDKATLMQRVAQRVSNGGRQVPEFVIDNMLRKYEEPNKSEGFDEIIFK